MPIISNLIVRIGASTDDFDKKVDSSLNKIKRFGASIKDAGEALSVGFSLPVIAAGGAALKAAADMEKLEKGLSATMRSTTAAAAEMEKLRDVAKLPGLGLPEAVQGSVRLQTLGTSAGQARKIMMELGNAIAIAGGSKADFAEAVRQLSQMQAVGKVTKENLDTITERAPAISKIMLDLWGPQSVADPAKFFEKAGISSKQFIDIITAELAKGERAGNTFANSWENLQDSITQAAAEFGKSLLPIAQRVLDDFLTPGIEKAKQLAGEFAKLTPETQNAAVGLTALAAAAPLAVTAVGMLIEKGAVLAQALNKLGIDAPKAAAAIGMLTLASQVAEDLKRAYMAAADMAQTFGLAVDPVKRFAERIADAALELGKWIGLDRRSIEFVRNLANELSKVTRPFQLVVEQMEQMAKWMRHLTGRSDEMDGALKRMISRNTELGAQQLKMTADLANYGGPSGILPKVTGAVGAHSEALKAVTIDLKDTAKETLNSIMLHERARAIQNEYNKRIHEAGEILQRYGTVNIQTAIALAKTADEQFRLNRALEEAPKMPGFSVPFKDIPKAPAPQFPGDYEEYRRAARNIGELGMQTKEQYDAMARAAKASSKAQQAALRQVSTIVTDLSRGIARSIIEWKGWGETLKSVAKNAGEAIIRELIEKALTKLATKILDVGGLFGKVFGGGTGAVMSATQSAGGAAASTAGAAASAGGSAASGAMSGIMGTIGAIGSVVGAVSGIIGNFQMAHMNTALGRIEESTRYMKIWMGEQSQNLLWCAQKSTELIGYAVTALDAIGKFNSEMLANLQQMNQKATLAGGVTITGDIYITAAPGFNIDAFVREMKLKGNRK